jgi:hypothetical protein
LQHQEGPTRWACKPPLPILGFLSFAFLLLTSHGPRTSYRVLDFRLLPQPCYYLAEPRAKLAMEVVSIFDYGLVPICVMTPWLYGAKSEIVYCLEIHFTA